MHLLGRRFGFRQQRALWQQLEIGAIVPHELAPPEIDRMQTLMAQYHNIPMSLADASLVAVAEALNLPRIFTLDADFRIYRLSDGRPFEILP
jgi:uncharacterized protein